MNGPIAAAVAAELIVVIAIILMASVFVDGHSVWSMILGMVSG